MNKMTEEKAAKIMKSIIVKRNHEAYKASKIKTNLLNVSDDMMHDKLLSCTSQAQLIDVALKNNMTISNTADALVQMNLCTSYDAAIARIKRHKAHDTTSRIIKRALAFSTFNKTKDTDKAEETSQVSETTSELTTVTA